eukprot:TRINITY_DN29259_c0_g1_i2.p1 TRINITY_DN29259_c0_g1~~TRINITY_DN29259_c0_g1_i2.p1  ORF type:complete len:136 (+),score=11.79 TRINITY_DN29259_c0_g1_i2:273-680(+)
MQGHGEVPRQMPPHRPDVVNVGAASSHVQRRRWPDWPCDGSQILGRRVDVEAHADDDAVESTPRGHGARQDAADLAAVDNDVVGPFDTEVQRLAVQTHVAIAAMPQSVHGGNSQDLRRIRRIPIHMRFLFSLSSP